jgi:putative flippase GtrA
MREARYLIVGILNFFVGSAIFYFLLRIIGSEVNYIFLILLTFLIGLPISHFNQRKFVWKSHNRYLPELWKFFTVNLPLFFANVVIAPLLIESLDLPLLVTQITTSGLIIVGTYLLHKSWTFK